jgi:hypothetical protein
MSEVSMHKWILEHARSGIARVDREAAGEAVIELGGEIIKVENEAEDRAQPAMTNDECRVTKGIAAGTPLSGATREEVRAT